MNDIKVSVQIVKEGKLMTALIDITGKKYGMLTVIRRAENAPNGIVRWECKCDCGNVVIVRGGNLKNGSVKSCGCLINISNKSRSKHGMSQTRLYQIWINMKARCYHKTHPSYKTYGARGIKICNEWLDSFLTFAEWALANGYQDDLTIERIDNDKNYEPDNCKWIDLKNQANNRGSNIKITYKNETQNLSEWCKIYNKDYRLVYNRIHKYKWSFERAIFEPVHIEKRNKKG
jgi:hypothetical protein